MRGRLLSSMLAVPWRQAGLIAACVLAGAVASMALPSRAPQPRAALAQTPPSPPLRLDATHADQIDLSLALPPTAAGHRAAPPRGAAAGGWPGAVVGLLLGCLLAWRRERRGDRMRSAREARRALGLPVLGTIPTLSGRARGSYLEPPSGHGPADPA